MILLIEDNPDDQFLTLRALRKYLSEKDVVVASDAAEAMDYLHGTGKYVGRDTTVMPRLILLDLKLPRVDGLELLQQIRSLDRTSMIPVVILTSSIEERDLVACYRLGANSYVRKPVDFGEFAETIRQLGVYWLSLNKVPIRGMAVR